MVEAIVANLARERCIDEELKAADALKWVAEMNNIKVNLEEIVLREVIYQLSRLSTSFGTETSYRKRIVEPIPRK